MAFRLHGSDLLISVIHPDIDPIDMPVPIPPPGAHPPSWIDDLRAVLAHASATLDAHKGVVAPPQTLVEATALEQHLVRALRLVREVKDQLATTGGATASDDVENRDTGQTDAAT